MPIVEKDQVTLLVSEGMSTRAAADVLAAQTRAFGNASAKLSLQMATDRFLRAKEALLHEVAAPDEAEQENQ